jgi:hypothetical protein
MKQFDSRIIDKKAEKLLENHISMFSEHCGEIDRIDNRYVSQETVDGCSWSFQYAIKKKWISKLYDLECVATFNGVDLPDDFKLKMATRGKLKLESVEFKDNGNGTWIASRLNLDDDFKGVLCDFLTGVDVANLFIRYDKTDQSLSITVRPYAGAFLWLMIPPVFYGLRLKAEEIILLKKMVLLIAGVLTTSKYGK